MYLGDVKLLWPVPGFTRVTSGFRPADRPNHNGIDIGRNLSPPVPIDGARVVAAADGVVTRVVELHSSMGNMIELSHTSLISFSGVIGFGCVVTRYMHNRANLVVLGQRVVMGDAIALVGNTGNSTGPHLHFEVIIDGSHVDPLTIIC